MVVLGDWTPKCDYSSSRPPKGTVLCCQINVCMYVSLRKSASFKLSTVKNPLGVWPVASWQKVWRTHTQTHTHTGKFIFFPCIALDRQKCNLCPKTKPTEWAKISDAHAIFLPSISHFRQFLMNFLNKYSYVFNKASDSQNITYTSLLIINGASATNIIL